VAPKNHISCCKTRGGRKVGLEARALRKGGARVWRLETRFDFRRNPIEASHGSLGSLGSLLAWRTFVPLDSPRLKS